MHERSRVTTSSTIRVLHVTAVPLSAVVLVGPLARRQAERGYSVEFACGPGEHLDQLRQMRLPVTVVPMARRILTVSHIASLYRLWSLIRARQYHVVHVHTPVAAFLARIAAAAVNTPIIIYHMRGSWWDSASSIARMLFSAAEKIAGRWTTHTFTINCTDAAELVSRGIVDKYAVTCLHCGGSGVDLARFDPARIPDKQRQELRNAFGFRESDVVIGYIGRLVAEKGIFELITAFQRVIVDYPDARLLIVGGTLSSERDRTSGSLLQSVVTNHPALSKRVVFTGFRNDVPEMMAMTDIVVLPSHREGFGMVLAEAAAMGRATITTNTRGGREAVVAEQSGIIVPVGNVSALQEAMMRLASDSDLRRRMGEEGRRIALERFDGRLVFEKVNTEYVRLLQKKRLPVPEPQLLPQKVA